MSIDILSQIATDKVTGFGVLKNVFIREVKDKDKKTVIGEKYIAEFSKLNAVLTLETTPAIYKRLVAEISNEMIVKGKSFIQYEADVTVEADAFAWSNKDGSGAMAISKYDNPVLTDYKKASK
ncbi:MAG: hypothetical protein NE327_06275 [Lentisphaeraceae bacterium]|nr:hypothetical protein [Lentisphaeraceae bacterium]